MKNKSEPKVRNRQTISDAQLTSELIKLFERGNTAKANSYELLRTRFKISKQRCLNFYDKAIETWQTERSKADNEQIQANAKETLKSGLKSKIEKQKHLQEQIDAIEADINAGIMVDYVVVAGKLQVVNKIMDAETKAFLRKTMKDIYAELNKMDGSYAAQKMEISETKTILPPNIED
jgi:hypothetical protein